MYPLHDDDGDQIGWALEAEDGALIGIDLDGAIVSAATPDGEPLDPAGYELADPEPDTGDYVTREELAAFAAEQQRAANEQAQIAHNRQRDISVDADVAQQVATIEAQLGRDLTVKEMRGLGERLATYIDAGREPDAFAALEQLGAEGKPLLDIDKRSDRQDWMTQRLLENERVASGEDLAQQMQTPQGTPSRDSYDLDNGEQRRQWMNDRVSGALDDDQAHASVLNGSDT